VLFGESHRLWLPPSTCEGWHAPGGYSGHDLFLGDSGEPPLLDVETVSAQKSPEHRGDLVELTLELVEVELLSGWEAITLRGPDAQIRLEADEGHVNLYSKIGGPNR